MSGQGLQISLGATIQGNYTEPNTLAAVNAGVNINDVIQLTTGAGLDQADGLYTAALNIAASGNLALDLSALTDPLGQSLAFLRIKAIIIIADPTNTNDILLEGGASNPFLGPLGGTTPTLATQPGGITMLVDPTATAWAVNASTAHTIKLVNSSSGTAVTGKLIIIGAQE